MTPDQTHGEPDETTPEQRLAPQRLAPESRAARSLTDRSPPEDTHPDAHLDAGGPGTDGPPHPDPERGPRLWPRVVGVLILLLGVGGAWLWQNPGFLQNTFGSAHRDDETSAIKALEARVARLERQQPTDLTALTQRLDALEQRTGQPADLGPADLGPLRARLDALEVRPAAGGATASPGTDIRPLQARIEALSQQVQALSARDPAEELRVRVDALTRQLNGLTAGETKQTEASDHTERLSRLAAASIDLGAGHPLGSIPEAPPALARFATTPPPTEAALRLGFPPAVQAALKVSKPDTEGKPFLDSVLARLQDFRLITVRKGDNVVIGNATAATLAQARGLLDAGDLAGAAREVATLTGPPAEAMASWLADAQALVAAREALAALAGNG